MSPAPSAACPADDASAMKYPFNFAENLKKA